MEKMSKGAVSSLPLQSQAASPFSLLLPPVKVTIPGIFKFDDVIWMCYIPSIANTKLSDKINI